MLNGIFSAILFFALIQVPVTDFKEVNITKKIKVSVPVDFVPMNDEEIRRKLTRKPTAAYTSRNRLVDFSVNIAPSTWSKKDFPLMKSFYKAGIANIHSEVKFLQEDTRTIDGQEFAVFEYVGVLKEEERSASSRQAGTRKYTYLLYAIHQGHTLVFNFTCADRLRPIWQPVAKEMMGTVQVD